jgi:hypothetical protein
VPSAVSVSTGTSGGALCHAPRQRPRDVGYVCCAGESGWISNHLLLRLTSAGLFEPSQRKVRVHGAICLGIGFASRIAVDAVCARTKVHALSQRRGLPKRRKGARLLCAAALCGMHCTRIVRGSNEVRQGTVCPGLSLKTQSTVLALDMLETTWCPAIALDHCRPSQWNRAETP